MTVSVGGGEGGKKKIDAELNLVPFIDFLSTLIAFLLVSAVWTQLARINVTQKNSAGASPTDAPLPNNNDIKVSILIDEKGFLVKRGPVDQTRLDKNGTEYPYDRLVEELSKIKGQFPDKKDLTLGGKLGNEKIPYDIVIRSIDYCIKAGFPTVTVAPIN